MDPFYSFLPLKCHSCGEPLIRIAQSETDDRVVCPTCFAVGEYKHVVEHSAGLSRSVFVTEETKEFIRKLRDRRDRMF